MAGGEVLPAEPVNIGSGKGTALKDLAQRMLALTGSTAGVEVAPARHVEVRRFTASVERMRSRLGLEPPADPLAALAVLWMPQTRWLRSQPGN